MFNFIFKDVSLSDKNWFETGGNAEFYANPKNTEQAIQSINFAKEQNMNITFLGSGANVLISDKGIKGLVIHSEINDISYYIENEDVYLTAGSGLSIEDLINYSLNNNILGLEEFSGIPGTVGGAVYINLHYFKFLISQFITSAKVYDIENKKIIDVDNDWFEFGYDYSKLFTKKYFLLNTTFKLKKCNNLESSFAKGRSYEIIRHRKQRYPYKGTCGSFFRNFKDEEVSLELNGKKIIFSGYYLDQVGVKGSLRFGNAGVSSKHANMIENFGEAKSEDIINVAKEMQKRVFDKYGILLMTECELLGFEKYPLYNSLLQLK